MLRSKNKNIYLILLLIVYETLMYLLCKLSPFKPYLLGSEIDFKTLFIPQFIYLYISWYLMLLLVPYLFLKKNKESFYKYITALFLAITISTIIFFFFPTTMLRENIVINNLSTFLVNLIYLVDTPVLNCLPSMHCIICFLFIYIALNDTKITKGEKLIIVIWSFLVILSTLFVKQHVILDVISAFIISITIYLIIIKFKLWNKFSKEN